MDHLMHELVGRSIARERERDLAQRLRTRDARPAPAVPDRRHRPGAGTPRPRPVGPVVAHA